MKTVVVLGASYGGARAARLLAESIPDDWRIIVIDRNSHANHLYVLQRFAVLPGHEHKAFIPYTHLFGTCPHHHLVLHATVTNLTSTHVTISRSFPHLGIDSHDIAFDYCIYALGSLLPQPIDVWYESPEKPSAEVGQKKEGTKKEGMAWLQRSQRKIKDPNVRDVVVVGGGALGIQFATDIKSVYSEKNVTLIHSRPLLLNRFDPSLHDEVIQAMEDLSINVLLSTRLDLASLKSPPSHLGTRLLRTSKGEEIAADMLLLCTGQTPNTELIKNFAPECVDPVTKLVSVGPGMWMCPPPTFSESDANSPAIPVRTLRSDSDTSSDAEVNKVDELLASLGLSDEESSEAETDSYAQTPYKNFFVIGDAADAFGAIKAGHNAYYQAEVAARNILRLIDHSRAQLESEFEESEPELDTYVPAAPMIKVSVGLHTSAYQMNGLIGSKQNTSEDLDAPLIWKYFGAEKDCEAEEGMFR